jgi:hypothetical protein
VFGALAAVHIADYLQSRHLPASRCPLVVQFDEPYMQALQLLERIESWEQSARPM